MPFISYAQNFEDVTLWRALKDVQNGFYIDVGASDPVVDSVTLAFSQRGWTGINVEPLAKQYEALTVARPLDINLCAAVGETASIADFYEIEGSGLSTTDATLAARHGNDGRRVMRRPVRIVTISDICRQHAPAVIHFLKIDCEGAERSALLGADFETYRPWIVLLEATVPNAPTPNHQEWEPLLIAARYGFAWFDGLNRFYVAAEHFDRLAPLLAQPPNVFDDFKLASAVGSIQAPASSPLPSPAPASAPPALEDTPIAGTEDDRIVAAQRCRDCDDVPKVADAGIVRTEPDGSRVQIMHNGLKVDAGGYYGGWMSRLIERCQGHHEPQEERVFHEAVRAMPPDATMIELGGYWSYYTAWFLQGAPQRRAVVLEPDPVHRAVGERTMALNGLQASFLDGVAGASPAAAAPFRTETSGEIPLPTFSVPQLMDLHGITRLDLLHCDTQGAELAVLEGCRELFAAGRIGMVFVSTPVHHISGDPLTHQRCLTLLRAAGAVIEAEHGPYESFSGDGLVVARFGPALAGWRPVRISHARPAEALFRDPAFDLADALIRSQVPDRDFARQVASDLFEALLFRPLDAGSVVPFTEAALASRGIAEPLRTILHSSEFQLGRAAFDRTYFEGAQALGQPPRVQEASPVTCPALLLEFKGETPLGAAGQTIMVPNDRTILPTVMAHGAWMPEHAEFMRSHVDPARRYALLDIGANVGLFTRQVLRVVSAIETCHCVEPDPGNYRALVFNMAGTGHPGTHTHNVALGDTAGPVTFYRDDENCGNYSLHADAMRDRPFGSTVVTVMATAEWMRDHAGGDSPILWKSDTQGNDEAIVAATPMEVWRRVQVAILGLWRIRKGGPTPAGFLERVADMPNRRFGGREVSVADVAAYLASDDWAHDDLLLWR